MADARADNGNVARSLVIWGGALVAGIIVGWIFGALFGLGAPPGLVFGALVFLALPYLISRGRADDGPVHAAVADARHVPVAEPEPVRDVAPAAEPTEAAELGGRVHEALRVDSEVAEAGVAEAGAGISERVREAAKAAGEAARAAVGDPVEGERPVALAAARGDGPDNLKKIKGVGPKIEGVLHGLGIFHLDQIAAWGPREVAWMDSHLEGFQGRVSRDDWVGQAKLLAGGGDTEFSQRVDRGEVYE